MSTVESLEGLNGDNRVIMSLTEWRDREIELEAREAELKEAEGKLKFVYSQGAYTETRFITNDEALKAILEVRDSEAQILRDELTRMKMAITHIHNSATMFNAKALISELYYSY